MDSKRAKARTEALRASASERTCQSGSVAVTGGDMRTRNPSPMDSRRSSWRFPCRQARYHEVQAELVHPSPTEILSRLRAARKAASQSTIAPQRWQGKRRSCWAWKASLLSVEFPDPTPLWFPGLHGYPLSARGPSRGMHRLSCMRGWVLLRVHEVDISVSGVDSNVGSWFRYGQGLAPPTAVKRHVRGVSPWRMSSWERAYAQSMCFLAKTRSWGIRHSELSHWGGGECRVGAIYGWWWGGGSANLSLSE